MLYIIGLGLNVKGISKEGIEVAKRCKKVYLEEYTVDYPYSLADIIDILKKDIHHANREKVESLELVDEAEKSDIALLVYGAPLAATTHISLLEEAKRLRVKCRVIHAGSVFDAVSETGLQLYKFGKTASLPKWDRDKNYTPESFIEIIKDNQKINAHTLILADIGMGFGQALDQLIETAKKHKIKLNKILVCSRIGMSKGKIYYNSLKYFEDFGSLKRPYCFIIPGKLSHNEAEFLKRFEYD
mgnify:CR=1 FL=1